MQLEIRHYFYVKNYVVSKEGWLSVTPGQHAKSTRIVEKLKNTHSHTHSLQLQNYPCICGVKGWKTAVKEPVSNCSSTTEHLVIGAHLATQYYSGVWPGHWCTCLAQEFVQSVHCGTLYPLLCPIVRYYALSHVYNCVCVF